MTPHSSAAFGRPWAKPDAEQLLKTTIEVAVNMKAVQRTEFERVFASAGVPVVVNSEAITSCAKP